jgi:hypothetical protein
MTNREVLRRGGGGEGGGHAIWQSQKSWNICLKSSFSKVYVQFIWSKSSGYNELITEDSRQREDNTVICKRVTFFAIVLLAPPPFVTLHRRTIYRLWLAEEVGGSWSQRRRQKKPGASSRARICKPLKEPRNRFLAWRNRFLGVLNVYKYGLSTIPLCTVLCAQQLLISSGEMGGFGLQVWINYDRFTLEYLEYVASCLFSTNIWSVIDEQLTLCLWNWNVSYMYCTEKVKIPERLFFLFIQEKVFLVINIAQYRTLRDSMPAKYS